MTSIQEKELLLRRIIAEKAGDGRALIAFSGGVDSSLLLWQSALVLGVDKVTAVTASSPTSFPDEIEAAEDLARRMGIRHEVVPSGECSDRRFLENSPDRCYICKRIRYRLLLEMAEASGGAAVFDGSQSDDDPADRPGMRALQELGVASPLLEAGLGKNDIRELLSRDGFVELAAKQAQPCLATRIPTGTPITIEALARVGRGEGLLRTLGLGTVRLRDHFPVARIVTDSEGMERIGGDAALRARILDGLKRLGYKRTTLDLTEYGTGNT